MDLEGRIKRVLATVLRDSDEASEPDLDAGFVELGINSLGSVAVVEALNKELGITLGVEVMFDCLDAAELAALIRGRYGERDDAPDEPRAGDVAVIGISGRFAGARDLAQFWTLLEAGESRVGEIRRPGWNEADYYDADARRTDRSISKWGGLLEDIDVFDPRFFGISPAEAEYLDPQQRLFLQESYRAFEDSGYAPDALGGGRVGVYVGARSSGYKDQVIRTGEANSQVFLGTDMAILAARISYFLNLKGPTLTVDTACSSSLVAIHLAVQSVRRGESDLALAGGVFVLDSPEFYVLTSQTNMLSPDGACKTFDDDANGIAIGEGVGAVVLKSLRSALADGDHIHGVIRGSAINQDGRTKGITAPSARSQQSLLADAYADADVDPGTVGYLEAHGTGTKLGDPIEVNALREAFRQYTDRSGYCALGSHKGNFGHSIMTAGIAGVFKALLGMRHGKLPASLHVQTLNRHLKLDDSPFYVNTVLRAWPRPEGHPRRAGVSAFGFSGTNAHVVLEEAPSRPPSADAGRAQLFPLSARDPAALRRRVDELAAWLDSAGPDVPLADVAYTLAVGRTHFTHRTAVVASTAAELVAALRGREPTVDHRTAELVALAAEYRAGGKVDWARLHDGVGRRRVPLPTYPFAGERYWIGDGNDVPLLRPSWSPATGRTPAPPATGGTPGPPANRLVFAASSVSAFDPPGAAEFIELSDVEDGAIRVADRLRGLPPGEPVLVQLVVPDEGPDRLLGALHGLLLSAAQENLAIRTQLIETEAGADAASVGEWLAQAARLFPATHLRASPRGLQTETWGPEPDTAALPMWRENGVYLITGGTGGLGRILLDDIAERLGSATVVLAGRSPIGEPAAHPGIRVEYRQADVADSGAVRGLIRDVLAAHGSLSGVVHAAGVTHDGLLAGTTDEQLRAVLAPKVAGTVNLDEATRDVPIDFFVLFGSITGPLGILGRAGYAAANAFLDRFAEHRAALAARGERYGRSLTVDWPVWTDGGMRVSDETLEAMRRTTGFAPMATRDGLRALHRAVAGDAARILVASGDLARIRAVLPSASLEAAPFQAVRPETTPPESASAQPAVPAPIQASSRLTTDLVARLNREVTTLAARFLRVSPAELDPEADLHVYGFDSITLTAFTNRLNDTYGLDLTPPILFEHTTLGRLGGYLADNYAEVFAARWAPASTPTAPVAPQTTTVRPIPAATRSRPRPSAGDEEAIAVIGMSGVFPKAPDVPALWANLLTGTDAVNAGLDARWGARAGAATEFPWAGLVEGIDEFDAAFFGISPYEALQMDPQQRLLLTYAWKALEDAGYAPGSLAGSDTGLFVATFDSGYGYQNVDDEVEAHTAIGRTPSLGPNRFSYLLDLHGPSEPIETACSSSLVAVHRAVTALRHGECGLAVAGGVNVLVEPTTHTSLAKAGLLSPEGHCHTFSARADGFVRGEGAGMLVLKPLGDAERDGDQIYGLIRATAVNHGGRAQSLTAPNPRAQADLLVNAYRRAGVDPGAVGYIEAHGTGTKLGDPIEINALRAAFEQLYADAGRAPATQPHCGLGSVKTSIGHLELAAGVAGVIKVLMQLRRRTLVASLHTQPPNPYIELDGSPFYVVDETGPWPAPIDADGVARPRLAGVSSFGIGGVNAHAVLEEYISAVEPVPATGPALVGLSARTPDRLREQARQLLDFVRSGQCADSDLGSLAYTLQVGRDAMECRLAVTVTSLHQLSGALEAFLDGDVSGVPGLHHAEAGPGSDAVALIAGDEDLLAATRSWTRRGAHDKVLWWWVRGLDVDWADLHGDARPRRMSLPTYPFAGQRQWPPAAGSGERRPAPAATPEPGPAPATTAPSYLGAVQQHLAAAFRNSSLDGTE